MIFAIFRSIRYFKRLLSKHFDCEIILPFICIKNAAKNLALRCAKVYVVSHDYPYSNIENFMIERRIDQSSYLKILFFDALEDNDDGDDDDD